MKIEILGSGGALAMPMLYSQHQFAQQAREQGVPYSRWGPSIFIHDIGLLIDTPEEIRLQLERAKIFRVPNCIYSHWHPDHVRGLRVFESLNWGTWHYPSQNCNTMIYLPQQVAEDMTTRAGMGEALEWMESVRVIQQHVISDGEAIILKDIKVTPFRLAEEYVYAFLLEGNGKRVLIAPDELFGWEPPDFVKGVDLAILPMGIPEYNPLTGERFLAETHPVLKTEATYRQTLEMVKKIDAKLTYLTHIEDYEIFGYDELSVLETDLTDPLVKFAYDTLLIEI